MENIYSTVVKRLTEIGKWFIVHQLSLQYCFILKYYSSTISGLLQLNLMKQN